MSHHPYPSTDRALRQLGRHVHADPELAPHQQAARAALEAAARALGPWIAAMETSVQNLGQGRSVMAD